MGIVIAFLGLALFGTIGGFLLLSIIMGKMPSSTSELFSSPRFIAGCVCFLLALICACAML